MNSNSELDNLLTGKVQAKVLPLTVTATNKLNDLLEEFANRILAKAEGATIIDGGPKILASQIINALRLGCDGQVKLKDSVIEDDWGLTRPIEGWKQLPFCTASRM